MKKKEEYTGYKYRFFDKTKSLIIIFWFKIKWYCGLVKMNDDYIKNREIKFEDNFNEIDSDVYLVLNDMGQVPSSKVYFSPQNVTIIDGKLHIKTVATSGVVLNHWSGVDRKYDFFSGGLWGDRNKHFTYGRFELKCVLSDSICSWPAFWLLSVPSENGDEGILPEYDIFESWNYEKYCCVGGSVHWGRNPNAYHLFSNTSIFKINKRKFLWIPGLYKQYHIFSLEWTEKSLKWYIDGHLIKHVSRKECIHHKPMFIIIGDGVDYNIAEKSTFPTEFIVDWFRVYNKKEAN